MWAYIFSALVGAIGALLVVGAIDAFFNDDDWTK